MPQDPQVSTRQAAFSISPTDGALDSFRRTPFQGQSVYFTYHLTRPHGAWNDRSASLPRLLHPLVPALVLITSRSIIAVTFPYPHLLHFAAGTSPFAMVIRFPLCHGHKDPG